MDRSAGREFVAWRVPESRKAARPGACSSFRDSVPIYRACPGLTSGAALCRPFGAGLGVGVLRRCGPMNLGRRTADDGCPRMSREQPSGLGTLSLALLWRVWFASCFGGGFVLAAR